jgi:large subunit ribosomal protein L15
MPLQRRIPKRGFKNRFAIEYAIINLKDIVKIQDTDIITPEIFIEKGIIKDLKNGIKVLGNGDIQRPLTIKAHAFSASAISKISAAGGKAEVV